jgi:hypothetical protein
LPICIAGMHRSGTSMVSRLLNLCGLYLGPESEFNPPGPDNPEGHWENIHFVEINDRILEHLDAGWDLAPAVCKGWELRPQLAPLRKESGVLIERFNAHEPWGWKDPRNSLTLPFWKHLIPNLKTLVILRNPLEAAQSLHARNHSSIMFGLKLWFVHNQCILSTIREADCVVTHYNSYFHAPRAELRRVLDLLNISASDSDVDRACAIVSASLRHQNVPTEGLAPEVPPEILNYYLELCEQAGPVYHASLLKEDSVPSVPWCVEEENAIIRARDETITKLGAELAGLQEQFRQAEALNEWLQARILRLQNEQAHSRQESQETANLHQSLMEKVDERDALLHARDEAITSLKRELAESIASNHVLSAELATRAAEFSRITHSPGWRVLSRYGSFKYRYLLHIYRMLRLWPYGAEQGEDDLRTEAGGNKAPGRALG